MTIESNMTIEDYMRKASGRYKVVRQDLKPQKETQTASTDFNGILSAFKKPTRQNEQNTSKGLTAAEYRQRPVAYSYTRPSQQPSTDNASKQTNASDIQSTNNETPETKKTSDGSNKQAVYSTASELSRMNQYKTLSGLNDSRIVRSQATPRNASYRTGDTSQTIEKAVQDAADQYQISPKLIKSVIKAESNFDANAVSPAGAQGLMQLMPGTAKDMGVKNPFDIKQNIDGGSRYLKKMLDMFNGNVKQALSAYNAGPETVKRYNGNVPYKETRQYIDRIMDYTKTIA